MEADTLPPEDNEPTREFTDEERTAVKRAFAEIAAEMATRQEAADRLSTAFHCGEAP